MHAPENWWRFTGLILNFVGSMTLLWYSWRVLWITPEPSYTLAWNPFVSPWWGYGGLLGNILGFALQVISQVYGGKRRASPSPESTVAPSSMSAETPEGPAEAPPGPREMDPLEG